MNIFLLDFMVIRSSLLRPVNEKKNEKQQNAIFTFLYIRQRTIILNVQIFNSLSRIFFSFFLPLLFTENCFRAILFKHKHEKGNREIFVSFPSRTAKSFFPHTHLQYNYTDTS
jgi:hypothetical protein